MVLAGEAVVYVALKVSKRGLQETNLCLEVVLLQPWQRGTFEREGMVIWELKSVEVSGVRPLSFGRLPARCLHVIEVSARRLRGKGSVDNNALDPAIKGDFAASVSSY